ncbi:hypothetical protein J7L67_07370 [bacterium]|nr:hypothetical protein [bacterium]
MSRKIFITSIGTSCYPETQYSYNGKIEISRFAPVAIKKLIPDLENAETYLFLSKEALEKNGVALKESIGAELISIPIPVGKEDFNEIFSIIESKVGESMQLYLDITNALRSLQMIFFAISIYFTGLKNIEIKGIYYGAFEQKKDNKAPVIDLLPIVEAIELFYASRMFRDYGVSALIGEKLEQEQQRLRSEKKVVSAPKTFIKTGRILKKISLGLANADAMFIASKCINLTKVSKSDTEFHSFLPLSETLIKSIKKAYKAFSDPLEVNALTEKELQREERIIEWYMNHEQYKNALSLMREWLVNKLLFFSEKRDIWLDYEKARKFAERKINLLIKLLKDKKLFSPDMKKFAKVAQKIFLMRNKVSHGGFSIETDRINYNTIHREVGEYWDEAKQIGPEIFQNILKRSIRGKILIISPLGLAPGMLYTLLSMEEIVKCYLAELMLITSEQAQKCIEECLEKVGRAIPYTPFCLKNPYIDILSEKDIKDKWLDKIISADKIIINYTGGTSIMQVNIVRISNIIRSYDIPFKEVVVTDKRSLGEQQANPYVKGEVCPIFESDYFC